jgi:hypothetical protein
MEYSLYVSNKKCLGCGCYMLYSPASRHFKCFSTGENKGCQIVSKEEIEFNVLYGNDKLVLRPLKK